MNSTNHQIMMGDHMVYFDTKKQKLVTVATMEVHSDPDYQHEVFSLYPGGIWVRGVPGYRLNVAEQPNGRRGKLLIFEEIPTGKNVCPDCGCWKDESLPNCCIECFEKHDAYKELDEEGDESRHQMMREASDIAREATREMGRELP